MSKPTNKEILDSIQRTYILSEALNSELIWLKSYCKPEYVKIINEAKAKVNHLKVKMISDMTPEAKEMVEEIAFTFHEKVIEVINPKPSMPIEVECTNCGVSTNNPIYDKVGNYEYYYCELCDPSKE